MTFVRAYVSERGVNVLADWRVSDRDRAGVPSPLNGTLKVWLMSPGLALAYAGSVFGGIGALKRVSAPATANEVQTVVDRLREASTDGSNDFLVCVNDPPSVYEIKDGTVRSGPSGWLGNRDAFSAYQERVSADPTPSLGKERSAFDAVVESGQFEDVGGIVVHVIPTRNGLEYAGSAHIFGGYEPMTIPSGVPTPAQFGNAATGAYGYVTIGGASEPALGIYFPHGRFGALFAPRLDFRPKIMSGCSQQQFVDRVNEDFNVRLDPTLQFG